jgi:hypothetical protein
MCLQAMRDPAAIRFYVRALLLDIGSAFLCDCFSLLHRGLALLREVFRVDLHAFSDLATAGWEFTTVSLDIGGACLHCRAGLCCGDRPK